MATFRLPILGAMTRVEDTGEIYWARTPLGGTNVEEFSLIFNDPPGADVQVWGNFFVPKNYSDNNAPNIKVVWFNGSDVSPTGVVAWEFKYMAIADGESYNGTFDETVTTTTTNPGTWLLSATSTLALDVSTSNFVVDDDVRFTLSRDDSADTAVDTHARVRGVFFEYQDT